MGSGPTFGVIGRTGEGTANEDLKRGASRSSWLDTGDACKANSSSIIVCTINVSVLANHSTGAGPRRQNRTDAAGVGRTTWPFGLLSDVNEFTSDQRRGRAGLRPIHDRPSSCNLGPGDRWAEYTEYGVQICSSLQRVALEPDGHSAHIGCILLRVLWDSGTNPAQRRMHDT